MYEANIEITNEDFDIEMQRTSWFTSLLMNASGNYKKAIKPQKLYEPLDNRKGNDKPKGKKEQKAYMDKQREKLKKKFNI